MNAKIPPSDKSPQFFRWRCPCCHSPLAVVPSESPVRCEHCGRNFPLIKGIPFLVSPDIESLISSSEPPEPIKEKVIFSNIAFHNTYGNDYESDVSTYDIFREDGFCQKRIRETLAWAATKSGTAHPSLVDFCCGTGNILRNAKGLFPYAVGFDLSGEMLEIARQRGHSVFGADACNVPIESETVDCVTAFSALHHIHDYENLVREMGRVLKPGGVFYTDWDPNGHVTHRGWAVHLAVELIKTFRKWRIGGMIEGGEMHRLAEYHHHSGEGFQASRVNDTLKTMGFSHVGIYYHADPPSLFSPIPRGYYGWAMAFLKTISGYPPTRENIFPWVAIIAVK